MTFNLSELSELCCCKRMSSLKNVKVQQSRSKSVSVEMHVLPSPNKEFADVPRPRSMSDCTEQIIVHDLQYGNHDAAHVTKAIQRPFSNPCKRTDFVPNLHFTTLLHDV